MIIAGLIFNLIGSLFLASQIIGIDRLKKIEQKMLELPTLISFWLLGRIVLAIFITTIKIEFKNYKLGEKFIKGSKLDSKEINELLKNHSIFHGEESLGSFFENILKDPVKVFFLIGLFFWGFYLIILSPLIGIITGTVRLFSKIQNTYKIESLLGVIGVVLLLIGFALQLIGNF